MTNQKGFISIILSLVVVAILAGGVVYLWQNTTQQSEIDNRVSEATASLEQQIADMQANLAAEEAEDQIADWLTYKNEDLKLSFKYPETWGSIAVKYMDETMTTEELKWPNVFSGRGVSINFSSSSVNMLLASADFSSFLGESYNGDQDLSLGCASLDENHRKYCQEVNIAGQDTYGYFENINYECSGDKIKYSAPLNVPDKLSDYSGLKISLFIEGFPIDTDDHSDPCGRPQQNMQENLEVISNRNNLNNTFLKQLQESDKFLESFKFLD